MEKNKVWIIQTGEPMPGDPGQQRKLRAYNLADILLKEGADITILTSRFNHMTKDFRDVESTYTHEGVKVRLIDSPGYKNNISLSRLWDHFILAKNLRRVLKNEKNLPDTVFIGYPPIEVAFIAVRWCKKNSIKSILDFKDLWPEIFLNIFNGKLKLILKIILWPYFFMARYSVGNSNHLISMSEPFLKKAQSLSERRDKTQDLVIPLTSPTEIMSDLECEKEWLDQLTKKTKDKFVISFAGTFMNSVFDFSNIIETITELKKNNISCCFLLAGDGYEREKWEEFFVNTKEVHFLGWIDKKQLSEIYNLSHLVLIPLTQREDFALSIPNKAIDAFNYGKVVATSCEGYLSDYLINEDVGFLYKDKQNSRLSDFIIFLDSNNDARLRMERNSRNIYEKYFEFDRNYRRLSQLILD